MDGLQSIALEGEAIIDVHGVTVSLLNLSAPDPPDEEVWARLAKLSSWQIFINAPHYEFWHEGSWLATLPNGVPKLLRAIIGRDLAGAIEDAVESEPVESACTGGCDDPDGDHGADHRPRLCRRGDAHPRFD